jgi:hypothetical protein
MEMAREYFERTHTEQVVLNIGQSIGALVVYAREELRGREMEISLKGYDVLRTHTAVLERKVNGRTIFAGVFPSLPAGDYKIWSNPPTEVTIAGGQVAEVDCRDSGDFFAPYAARPHGHDYRTSHSMPFPSPYDAVPNILPPRYQNGKTVCAAPMGSAPLRYTDDGKVAWNEIWSDFCDLALAGGPSHRDTLLEPVPPEEVRANLEAYEGALAEIERGFRLVTGLPIVRSEALGWIGLRCEDEQMALWLLRAIVVENVCVRREGTVLFLPAGPAFRLEKEIKNVITVVAKTNHYWTEHVLMTQ